MLDKQPFVHDEIAQDFSLSGTNAKSVRTTQRHCYPRVPPCLSEQYCSYAGDKTDRSDAGRRNRLLSQALFGENSTRKKDLHRSRPMDLWPEDEDWLFGFENICEMLKLDPDYIRRVLKQSEQARLLDQLSEQQPSDFPAIALRLAS